MIIYYYIGNKSSQFMIFGARKFPQNLDYVHKLQVWVSQQIASVGFATLNSSIH